jgi:peptidoglycan/LPS O-acetylase OafA/YrhL
MPRRSAAGRIPGLDGLRAVSILLVLIGHAATTLPANEPIQALVPYLGNTTLGVTTFFVISGFLITSLLRREWERSGTIGLRAFYIRRVFRIFPAFYAFLAVVAMLRAAGWIHTTPADITVAATFLTNYKHVLPIPTNDDYWFVGHFWTLSLEEQFYLFWPVTILAAGLARTPRVATLIVLCSPLIRIASYVAWPGSRGHLTMMLHTAADPLMIGGLAALWQGGPAFEAVLKKLSAWYWPLSAAVFLFVASPWLAARYHGEYDITVGLSLNALAIALILLWVVRHPESLLGRALSARVVCHIGVLSYSLYLWQQLFLTPKNHTWFGAFPLNLVACVLAAEMSYWAVEHPFLRLRERLQSRS